MELSSILKYIALAVVALSSIVEVSKIKINPWSDLARWIGRKLTAELDGKVDRLVGSVAEISAAQSAAEAKAERRDTDLCRTRILRFADELRRGIDHSEEFFTQVMDDITCYTHYCDTHPEYQNSKACAAIAKIERTYQDRLDKDDFL